jgi:hypothetical protein
MQEVDRENLEAGKEYYIICLTEDDNKNLVPNKAIPKLIATFEKLEATENSNGFKFTFFNFFREINKLKNIGYDVQLNLLWKFYEVKKNTIQQQMENRALNLIIQKILGDEYFKIEFI